jgi:hypothetical protein
MQVLKAVVAEFDAGELITQRELVSHRVHQELTSRAQQFGIVLDDISITHLTFGRQVHPSGIQRILKRIHVSIGFEPQYYVDSSYPVCRHMYGNRMTIV